MVARSRAQRTLLLCRADVGNAWAYGRHGSCARLDLAC